MPNVLIKNAHIYEGDDFDEIADLEGLKDNRDIKILRLPNDADLSQLTLKLEGIETILIEFPNFADGRGFSVAKVLRQRYKYQGLLIADGELIADQYAFALQCGFDAIRVSQDVFARQSQADWQNSLKDFSHSYQRGYIVKIGPALSVFDARISALDSRKQHDPYFGYSAEYALQKTLDEYGDKAALISSFGTDSAVLLHMAAKINKDIPILFLDTGKHFRETLAYRDQLIADLGLTHVQNITPDSQAVQDIDEHGQLHKTDPDRCCALRKVEPLERVTSGYQMHITGRKRYQTLDRNKMPIFEDNDSAGVNAVKLNPLAYWTAKDVTNYMEYHDLPRHPIAALGYPSIGCQPCTSRVADNEDARAGRWRSFEKSECGIHYQNGKWVKARS